LAGAPHQIPLGEITVLPPDSLTGFKGAYSKGKGGRTGGRRRGPTSKVRGKGRGKGEKLLPSADGDDTPGWEYHLSM